MAKNKKTGGIGGFAGLVALVAAVIVFKQYWPYIVGGAAVIVLLVLLASHKKNQQPQAPYMYYGNVSTKTYHFRSCRTLTSVGKGNLAGFHTKEEAQRKGYKPCNICKP